MPRRNSAFVPPGGDARELERHADRFGTAGREQDLPQVARRERRELCSETHGVLVGEAARRERQRPPARASPLRGRADGRGRPGARCFRGSP